MRRNKSCNATEDSCQLESAIEVLKLLQAIHPTTEFLWSCCLVRLASNNAVAILLRE